MNDMLDPNKIAEATRLTRAGRLAEAVALLQRMLRAESPRDMTFGTAVDIVPTGRKPPIIDATAKSEETACPPSSYSASKVARRAGHSQARPRPLSGTCSLG
jgi:hypothetical protein